MSVINDLGDHCINLATAALREIADAFMEELDREPTLADVCEILTWGARSGSERLVRDGSNRGLTIFGYAKPSADVHLRKGDLIGVPHSSGQDTVLVYLGMFGTFGDAFGIFDDLVSPDESLTSWQPSGVQAHPLFVDDEYVQLGRWSVKAHRPDLVSQFREPEMFHDPQDDPGDGSHGRYGLAETPSGELRNLDREEAEAIFGAVPDGYRHCFTGDDLETYVRMLLPRSVRN